MQEWYILGVGKGVLFREVSSVQECPHREREVPLLLCCLPHTPIHTLHSSNKSETDLPRWRSAWTWCGSSNSAELKRSLASVWLSPNSMREVASWTLPRR